MADKKEVKFAEPTAPKPIVFRNSRILQFILLVSFLGLVISFRKNQEPKKEIPSPSFSSASSVFSCSGAPIRRFSGKEANKWFSIPVQERCVALKVYKPEGYEIEVEKDYGAPLQRYAWRNGQWVGPIAQFQSSPTAVFYWQPEDGRGYLGYNGEIRIRLRKTINL